MVDHVCKFCNQAYVESHFARSCEAYHRYWNDYHYSSYLASINKCELVVAANNKAQCKLSRFGGF